ncbi:cupin domain-containing protein [Amycolatopsis nigrescens]|uniref:cupin domain-containing protein n=1 Tax=Amycolatopsis nigrescens TaxID=381445 RepID=UPI00036F4E40|nr:cupin domain-containing protein [Amycolatopsis nigrescens]
MSNEKPPVTIDVADLKPFDLGSDQGKAIWHMGSLMVFKATSEETGGQYWLAEQTATSGYASPVHVHTREDELFYVLEGELSIEIDGVMHNLEAGSTLFGPRNLPHSYKVESPTAKWLVLGTPGGYDGWFFDTGKPAERLEIPAFNPDDIPDFGAIIAAVEAYGGKVLGPPRA